MNKLLIGFGATAQVGKDYSAIALSAKYDVERISFADKLKEDLALLFNRRGLDLYTLLADPVTKETVRPLLVSYGQTLRQFNSDVWVNAALDECAFEHELTVITDVRFPNEVDKLHAMGGVYIHIDSAKAPANDVERTFAPILRTKADYTIFNSFKEDYSPKVIALVDSIFQKKALKVADAV